MADGCRLLSDEPQQQQQVGLYGIGNELTDKAQAQCNQALPVQVAAAYPPASSAVADRFN